MAATDDKTGAPIGEPALSLLEALPIELFLFEARSQACAVATAAARRAGGYAAADLAEATLIRLFPELTEEELTARLAEAGLEGARFETMLRCAPGGYRSVTIRLARLGDEDGWLAVTLENTEPLQRLSRALMETDSVFQSVLATAPDAVIVIDVNGVITRASDSAEAMFGYGPGELTGQNVSILAPQPHRDRHDGYIARYLRTGEKRIIGVGRRIEAQRKDGVRFPAELAIGEAFIGDRRLFTGFLRDISRRVEAERRASALNERLDRADRLATMGEMAAAIAHELNQPLMAVVTYVQAGLRYLRAPEKSGRAAEAFEKAVTQAKRASDIAHRARGFISGESGGRARIDLNQIVREAVELSMLNAQPHPRLTEIEIDFALDPTLPEIQADATQIQQVVVNLMRNAVDALTADSAAETPPRIVVQTRRFDDSQVSRDAKE